MGGKIIIFPQNAGRQDWVANLQNNPKTELFSANFTVQGTAKIKEITGLKDPLLSAFTRKYGERDVRKRYWGQHRYAEIEITSSSNSLDYIQLVYAELEAAFDGVAENYDHHIMDNEMNLWLRNRSVNLLKRSFRPGETVLEIGCGTGTETLSLAEYGVSVIASDISSKMLRVLSRKASRLRLEGRVKTLHARPYELREKLKLAGVAEIDGAYSTYGAINTDPLLPQLFSDLASIIRPKGVLILGVWNKYCLSGDPRLYASHETQLGRGKDEKPCACGQVALLHRLKRVRRRGDQVAHEGILRGEGGARSGNISPPVEPRPLSPPEAAGGDAQAVGHEPRGALPLEPAGRPLLACLREDLSRRPTRLTCLSLSRRTSS